MKTKTIIILLIFFAVLGIIPLFLPSFFIKLLCLALVYGIFAMSLDILLGYAGLPSLGHAAFFGVSAYVVALLNIHHVFPPGPIQLVLELIAALGSAAVLAIIFGLLTLRSRGTYFLMLTLALSMLVWGVAYQWYDVTGGSNGLAGIKRPDLSIIGLNITTPLSFFYFTLFFFVVATLLMYYITTGSSFGRRLTGIKSNELRMRTLGYNVWFHLNVANFFAGLFAGLAGWLFVYLNSFVSPPILHLTTSAQVLLMTILGGAGTLFGPLFGAIIIIFLQDFMTSYIDRWTMIFGIIYILVIIFIPRGVYVLLQETIPQLSKKISLKMRGTPKS